MIMMTMAMQSESKYVSRRLSEEMTLSFYEVGIGLGFHARP